MNESSVETVYNNTYFKINKNLLISTGLWPYRSRNEKLIIRVTIYSWMFCALIPNINGCRVWCGVDFCLCGENVVGVMYSIGIILKYFASSKSESKTKKVHTRVAANWINLTDAVEHSILKQYAKRGKLLTIIFCMYIASGGVIFSQIPIMPIALDLIFPLNGSRDKILIVRGEYFVNPFEYYYHLYVIYSILTVMSLGILTTFQTTYTEVVHQSLGIFAIVKHRLESLTKHNNNGNKDCNNVAMIEIIRLHQAALEFVDLIESLYNIPFLIVIGLFTVGLSIGIVLIMEQLDNFFNTLRYSLLAAGILMILFYSNFLGQQLTDHGSDLFIQTYMNEWYNIDKRTNNLLRIVILRCLRLPELTAGKLYTLNFENYGVIVRTIASYVTVIASFSK